MAHVDPLDGGTVATVEADPKKPWKAAVATLIAFVGTLWATLAGRDDLNDMGVNEWLAVIVTTLVTFAGTYAVRNPKVTRTTY